MMRIYIRDEDETPQRYPLRRLLRQACLVFHVPSNATCELLHFWGYGSTIGDMLADFDPSSPLVITVAELDALVEGVDEWFFNLEVRLLGGGLLLGLEDSAAMYIEGPSEGVAEVARAFSRILWPEDAD